MLKTAGVLVSSESVLDVAKGLKKIAEHISNGGPISQRLNLLLAKSKRMIETMDREGLLSIRADIVEEINKISSLMGSFDFDNKETGIVRLVKKAKYRDILPETCVIVRCSDESIEDQTKFLTILSSVIREELDSEVCTVHSDGTNIELQADIIGSREVVKNAVSAVTEGLSEMFMKRYDLNITASVMLGESEMQVMSDAESEHQFRKFAVKMMLPIEKRGS